MTQQWSPTCLKSARVVIIGAGFAGFQVAQQLANTKVEVVLLDR